MLTRRRLLLAGAALSLGGRVFSKVQAEEKATVVRFGTVAGVGTPGVYAALDQGYFKEAGLDVDVQVLAGGPAILAAIVGGSLDIGYGDIFAWTAALANGQKIKLLTPANGASLKIPAPGSNQSIVVRGDSNIKSAADLAGKSIATSPTPLQRVTTKRWLEKQGVDPKSVQLVSVSAIPALNATLKSGNVDAILGSDPFVQLAEKEFKAVVIAEPLNDLPDDTTIAAIYASEDFLSKHPEIARKFVAAYRKGAKYFLSASQAERGRVVEKFGQIKLSDLAKSIPDIAETFHYNLIQEGPINVGATQKWVETGYRLGEIPSVVNISDHLFETATAP
jgi:NitT/TauT family transport system substrate-binding protein